MMIRINPDFIAGTVVGFAAGVMVKGLPEEDRNFRGAVKSTMKIALKTSEKLKEKIGFFKEDFEDIGAEVRSEIRSETEQSCS